MPLMRTIEPPIATRSAPQTPDLRFLNMQAWNVRWSDRRSSNKHAEAVLDSLSKHAHDAPNSAAGLAYRTLAWQARWRGDYVSANRLARVAFDHLQDENQPSAQADLHSVLAVIHMCRGRGDLAKDHVQEGLHLINRAGEQASDTRVDLHLHEAILFCFAKQMERAAVTALKAMDMAPRADSARVHRVIAKYQMLGPDNHDNLGHAMQALVLSRRHNMRTLLPYTLETVANCHVALGQLKRARACLSEAERLCIEDEDACGATVVAFQKVHLEIEDGNLTGALDIARSGLDICVERGFSVYKKRFTMLIAQISDDLQDRDMAAKHWRALHFLNEAEVN
jgi:tetratricopeptide (TPR) repeat protein